MPRTQAIFEKVFSLPLDSSGSSSFSTQSCNWHHSCLRLNFEVVPSGLTAEVEASRRAREKISLESFQVLASSGKFTTFGELQRWMFSEHSAYSAARHKQQPKEELDNEVLKTY
jgi:hypothetical protein